MGREFHVRFCEGLGVQFPRATRLVVRHDGFHFLQKPFSPAALAHKVREVLDRPG